MKADQKTCEEVTLTLRGMFEAYAKRDLNGVLAFWAPDPDIRLIGSGADEKSVGVNGFAKILRRDWEQSDSASVELSNVAVSTADSVSWFTADITFHGKVHVDSFVMLGRLTGVLVKQGDNWMLVQMHFSVPSSEQGAGRSWPKPQSQK